MSEQLAHYGTGAVATRGGTSSEIAQSREMAEVQAQIIMARMAPRDQKMALDRILNACTRPGLAEVAVYQYARGGTDISGPSIRLAEAIAQNWGNMQYGVREIEQRNGESTCEAFAWDMETNTRVTKSFKVSHIRQTKKGATQLTDPRDIYEMVANQGARRVRSCILSVVPGDIVEESVKQCELTMRTTADVTADSIKKLLQAFDKYGVSKAQIEARIQRRIDSMTPAQMVTMRKIYASLKDGISKPGEWFDPIEDVEKAKAGTAAEGKPSGLAAKARAAAKAEAAAVKAKGDAANKGNAKGKDDPVEAADDDPQEAAEREEFAFDDDGEDIPYTN